MIETPFWFGDTNVTRLAHKEGPAPEALVMFHGFPARPPIAEAHLYKNAPATRTEMAKALLAVVNIDAYLPSYEGLAESRVKFRFDRSVTRSIEFAKSLVAQGYSRIHVTGHSWGALVGFNVHRALGMRAGRLALLSGALDLENEKKVRAFIDYYMAKYPEILGKGSEALRRNISDLDGTRRNYNPMTLVASTTPMPDDALFILHGRQDTYVDVEISRRFHQRAGGCYLELDVDHIYSQSLPRIIDEVVRFFKPF